jgi:hypothetical protein
MRLAQVRNALFCAAILVAASLPAHAGTVSFTYTGTLCCGTDDGTGSFSFVGFPSVITLADLTSFNFTDLYDNIYACSAGYTCAAQYAYGLGDLTSFSATVNGGSIASLSLTTNDRYPVIAYSPDWPTATFTITSLANAERDYGSGGDFSQTTGSINTSGPGQSDLSPACDAILLNAVTPTITGKAMQATFEPIGMTLAQAAAVCGVSSFDWEQMITSIPDPVPFIRVDGTLITSSSTPFIDPPPGGGYTYCQGSCDANPYIYSPANLESECAEQTISGTCILKVITGSGTMLNFYDLPSDPCIDQSPGIPSDKYLEDPSIRSICNNLTAPYGSFLGFRTQLVGVSSDGLVPFPDIWTWTDTYNGTSGGIATTVNSLPADPGTGTGGITITGGEGLSTPEPASALLLCLGLCCLLWPKCRRSGS